MISMKNFVKKGISTDSSKIDYLLQKDIVNEGKTSDCLKLVYLEVCNLQMWNYKILIFLVLSEPFSVEKNIFGTTSALNISV